MPKNVALHSDTVRGRASRSAGSHIHQSPIEQVMTREYWRLDHENLNECDEFVKPTLLAGFFLSWESRLEPQVPFPYLFETVARRSLQEVLICKSD